MQCFIKFVLSTEEGQFVPQTMVQDILDKCLPLFFAPDFPVEKMNWKSVEEYQPMIYHTKYKEVNAEIYKYLDENHPNAWFKLYFDLEARNIIG